MRSLTERYAVGLSAMHRYTKYSAGRSDPSGVVMPEHRMYGESRVHADLRQALPFLMIDQAVEDTRGVVTTLKATFPGRWIGAGYSSSGIIATRLADRSRGDLAAGLLSGPPFKLPFVHDGYDAHLRRSPGASRATARRVG